MNLIPLKQRFVFTPGWRRIIECLRAACQQTLPHCHAASARSPTQLFSCRCFTVIWIFFKTLFFFLSPFLSLFRPLIFLVVCSLLSVSSFDIHCEHSAPTFQSVLYFFFFFCHLYPQRLPFDIHMITCSQILFTLSYFLWSFRPAPSSPVSLVSPLTPMSSLFHPSLFPSTLPCVCSVLGMLPSRPRPPWSTSRPRLWRAPGPWSGSRASNSPSLTSPRRVLTTPQSPHRAWASCTRAQAAEAIAGARAGSGGVRLEPPGTEEEGQADQGQILAAGITWWSRSATEGWMSSHSCEFSTLLHQTVEYEPAEWMFLLSVAQHAWHPNYLYPAQLISFFVFFFIST